MSHAVHWVIPFAAGHPASPGGAALQRLRLPRIERLLSTMTEVHAQPGDEQALSMPHEQVLARALGLGGTDGLIPLAAHQALEAGHGGGAWAFITPCHWNVSSDRVGMGDPADLQLDDAGSRALLATLQPWFREEGIALHYVGPLRWLARGEVFRELPTASLDRVIGRGVDAWLPRGGTAAGSVRRLQQEVQMLLYQEPLNDQRSARGLPPVNSIWISGSGALPAQHAPAAGAVELADALRSPALRGDWASWALAWQELDARLGTELAERAARGEGVQLTLAGERSARTWAAQPLGWWTGLRRRLARRSAAQWMEPL